MIEELERWRVYDDVYNFEKVWGYETWIVNNEEYCGKFLHLKKHHRCSTHYHKKKDETFYIMGGRVLMELNDEVFLMMPGDAVRVRRGQPHRFTGLRDSVIIEFSTQHFEDDSYRSNKSEKLGWRQKRHLKKLLKRKGIGV
jgi:mannose-6-phosphate isomerase-like protein (cupin superfamily)